MSATTAEIDTLIDEYLAGKQPFMTFWSRFMKVYTGDGLSDAEAITYEPVYEVVYMGSAGEPPPDEQAVGGLGETEVRAQLRALRAQLHRPEPPRPMVKE